MRARAGLARTLWELGERAEAVGHYRDMLRLNPNDNQGIRHVLATCLLMLDDRDALEALMRKYREDSFAEWTYTRALLSFRQEGASKRARRELAVARKRNPHVPDYLLHTKRPPARAPEYITLGGPDEAAVYVAQNRAAWSATPGALAWLADVQLALPLEAGRKSR